MGKKIIKYSLAAIAFVIIFLIIANPNLKQFKEYIGERKWEGFDFTYKRTHNYLIYSTYEFSFIADKYPSGDIDPSEIDRKTEELVGKTGEFTGFLFNFSKD